MFDSLILIVGGKPAYIGSVSHAVDHFASIGFNLPEFANPADFILDIVSPGQHESRLPVILQAYQDTIAPKQIAKSQATILNPGLSDVEIVLQTNFIRGDKRLLLSTAMQTKYLFQRAWMLQLRDRSGILTVVGISFFIGLLLGMVYQGIGKGYIGANSSSIQEAFTNKTTSGDAEAFVNRQLAQIGCVFVLVATAPLVPSTQTATYVKNQITFAFERSEVRFRPYF